MLGLCRPKKWQRPGFTEDFSRKEDPFLRKLREILKQPPVFPKDVEKLDPVLGNFSVKTPPFRAAHLHSPHLSETFY